MRAPSLWLSLLLLACSGASQPDDPPAEIAIEAGGEASQGTSTLDGDGATSPPAEPAVPASMRALLDAHNRRRAEHCAPPLSWSSELAAHAQAWADSLRARGCAFEHSRSDYGENLAGGTSGTIDGEAVTEMWYRESSQYDYRRGRFSMRTGHFTQLVWTGTQRVGCGVTQCNGMDVWVCNYDPPGNVEGEYRENVRPRSCD